MAARRKVIDTAFSMWFQIAATVSLLWQLSFSLKATISSKHVQYVKLIVNVTVFMYILISSAAMYNVNPSNVILVHDDLDKPVGKYSLKHGGSAGWDVIVYTVYCE